MIHAILSTTALARMCVLMVFVYLALVGRRVENSVRLVTRRALRCLAMGGGLVVVIM